MLRILMGGVALCVVFIFAPLVSFAAEQCKPVTEYTYVNAQGKEITIQNAAGAKCEAGKLYTIVQIPPSQACQATGDVAQAVRIEERWQDGEKKGSTKSAYIVFTPPPVAGQAGNPIWIECKPGELLLDTATKKDERFTPFAQGASAKGIQEYLDQKNKGNTTEGINSYIAGVQNTDQLLKDFQNKKTLTTTEQQELFRTTQDQKILNSLAADQGIIGVNEAKSVNKSLDADLAKRLEGYSDPKTWGRYYVDQPPTPERKPSVVSAYEEARRSEQAGFVQKDADKTEKYIQYENARREYEDCIAQTTWYNRAFSCSNEQQAEYDSALALQKAGCKVEWSLGGYGTTPGEASCPESTVTTGSTETPEIPGRRPDKRIDNPIPSAELECRKLQGPAYCTCRRAAGLSTADCPSGDGQSASCASAETKCQRDTYANDFNSAACEYVAYRCQNGNQSPHGGYGGNPSSAGGGGYPSGGNPAGSNPNGYNGLSPAEQRMLERECFDYGNSNACSALKRYCEQNQNQSPGLGGIGQFIPIITSLISGGGQGGLGNLGSFGGGQQSQQCQSLNNSIDNSMCRQYIGTQFTNGKCECPSGQKWDGNQCKAENTCSQYPGTALTNGRCECPSGQQWDGSRCTQDGAAPAATLEAELACAPDVADIDETPIVISWQCRGADAAEGDGFETNNALSGSATTKLRSVDMNADATRVDLTLTCSKGAAQKKAICPTEINRPLIVAVATYGTVQKGQTATVGWIVKGMKDDDGVCKITSNKHPNFSQTGRNVVLTTPPVEETTEFTIDCTTHAGNTKEAKVVVQVAS